MTDMSFAFYKCNGLTALDVSNFDTKRDKHEMHVL